MADESNHIPNSDIVYSLLECGIDFVFLISLHTHEFCFQPSSAGKREMLNLAQSNSKPSGVCRDIPVDNWNLGCTHIVLNKIHIILINQTLKSKNIVTPFQMAQLFAEVAFQHMGKAGSVQQSPANESQIPGIASSEHPLTKEKVAKEQLVSRWLRENSCHQNSRRALSTTSARILKHFLAIKPELSTAFVICRHRFMGKEWSQQERGEKKEQNQQNRTKQSKKTPNPNPKPPNSACTVDTRKWVYVPRWGRSRMPLLAFGEHIYNSCCICITSWNLWLLFRKQFTPDVFKEWAIQRCNWNQTLWAEEWSCSGPSRARRYTLFCHSEFFAGLVLINLAV